MLKTQSRKSLPTQYLTRIAILSALAAILFYFPEIPIFPPIYKLDFSNLPALLGAFSMGPMAGVWILLIKSLTGLLHSSSAGVGELADFIMGAALIVPAAVMYRMNKTRRGALTGMLVGTLVLVVVSVLVNWKIMIPFYMGAYHMSMEGVVSLIQKVLPAVDSEWKLLMFATAPFNLIKGVVLSVLTALMYKRLSPLLHVRK